MNGVADWLWVVGTLGSVLSLGVAVWLWLDADRLRREAELTLKLAGRIHAESELLQKQTWEALRVRNLPRESWPASHLVPDEPKTPPRGH